MIDCIVVVFILVVPPDNKRVSIGDVDDMELKRNCTKGNSGKITSEVM